LLARGGGDPVDVSSTVSAAIAKPREPDTDKDQQRGPADS
jgi:hypothetical protein